MLSKPEIERYYNSGDITIDPFVPENVGSAQVDITLGEFIYRETDIDQMVKQANPNVLSPIYNPYDEEHVLARFQLGRGVRHDEWVKQGNHPLRGVSPDEEIILLQPGEMILAHTQEFIGGSCNFITTQMKARSTIGRNFLTVCACAGQGDINFFNRWTFEIHNRNRTAAIPLVRGRRIAQMLFFKVKPVHKADTYEKTGKYQPTGTLADLKKKWTPEMMLPRMDKDRESRKARGE